MKEINVAFVEPVGSHGGMDYYDSGLCAGLLHQGVSATWYTCDISKPCGNRPIFMQLTFVNIWGKDATWRRGARYILGLCRSIKHAKKNYSNIAHFHFFHVGVLEFLSVLFFRLFGFKVVATVHDVESFKPGLTFSILLKWTYFLCNQLIVHNQVSKDELINRSNVSINKIHVIPHGSYIGLVAPSMPKADARQALNVSSDEKVILFFGQIKEVKGLDLLIEALGLVKDKLKPFKLVIAGKVWKDNFSKYQELISKNGLNDFCKLDIRYIPDQEISMFYSAADLIVLPYRKIYQSGVLLMAMSYGTPVLASDLPGMAQIINDGENGFLFSAGNYIDLAEKLVKIFSYHDLSRITLQAENDMRTRFSWDEIAIKTISVYQKSIS
ncbi:glycosyltransferase family 4 protein [Methylobacillus flagellatus]|uniref:Glycosyl transferase, group 1 n=1 Tax=Methylobacillus flagellatus (strain ATCC 51484 / DSM 6875 / VKM B-1610 / KT) TaxID=265072 RepID=Q1GZQ5_METFK|nr:glycosyltransferase family 4 protein [Methylobacillus flagellatus]ABE50282.1 glycosyl transferase, group 1 [Methylobacillus flagellatus KT]